MSNVQTFHIGPSANPVRNSRAGLGLANDDQHRKGPATIQARYFSGRNSSVMTSWAVTSGIKESRRLQ